MIRKTSAAGAICQVSTLDTEILKKFSHLTEKNKFTIIERIVSAALQNQESSKSALSLCGEHGKVG